MEQSQSIFDDLRQSGVNAYIPEKNEELLLR
jgi:hypothetical protein